LTLSVPDQCCSTFDWVYLINVVLLLTLSVPDECCSTFDIECTWWMLFYFWHWVYLMNVVLLIEVSCHDSPWIILIANIYGFCFIIKSIFLFIYDLIYVILLQVKLEFCLYILLCLKRKLYIFFSLKLKYQHILIICFICVKGIICLSGLSLFWCSDSLTMWQRVI
jgi:hypothetical protein